jgi:peptidoglycan/xylan/chitin deacetylase (PgdA/CDA1 family)
MKKGLKALLYKTGVLSGLHYLLNYNKVTIVLFHRVIPKSDIRWMGANKTWSVSDTFFEQCIKLFIRHYNIISIEQFISYIEKGAPLPANSLLITFDDGWSDNEEFALPILERYSVPATIFIATDYIGSTYPFWQECIYEVCLRGLVPINIYHKWCSECSIQYEEGITEDDISKLIKAAGEIGSEKLKEIVNQAQSYLDTKHKAMLTTRQIKEMSTKSIAFGSHGKSHEPLTQVDNVKKELINSKSVLDAITSGSINTLAFPHSKYSAEIILTASETGLHYLFGGNETPFVNNKKILRQLEIYGRESINQLQYQDTKGDLLPGELATRLFLHR